MDHVIEREQATMEGIQGEGESLGCIERRATLRSLKAKVSISGVGASRVRRELLIPNVCHCLLLISGVEWQEWSDLGFDLGG